MRRLALCLALVAVSSGALPAWAGRPPAAGHIMTRWAKDVSPANVWPEYPRPQMVRKEWQSLNGLWDYAIASEGGEWKSPNVENATYDPLLKEPHRGLGRQTGLSTFFP